MTAPPSPVLTDEQTRVIETLLDLEPIVVLALRNNLRQAERTTKRCLSAMRGWVATADQPRIRYLEDEDWYEIVLAGTVIGYVKTTLYSIEGQHDGKTQLAYVAHRCDRRMLKDPHRPTLDDAVARIVQAWTASDQTPASLRLVSRDTADAVSRETDDDPEVVVALLAWIRVTTRRQGRAPTLGAAARAFGMNAAAIAELLTRPALSTLDGNRSDPSQPLRLPGHADG